MHSRVILLLISASVLATLHFLALQFYLYWQYLWFDVPMHFLGGATVAFIPFAVMDLRSSDSDQLTFPNILLFVIAVGIFWELFEVWVGFAGTSVQKDYLFDTAKDLSMDVLGGCVGYFVSSRFKAL